jgi:hypothetical protein
MLKDVTTIKISGANFDSLTTLDFFNPRDDGKVKTVKGTLLYGKNGTGKSTIARAFRKLAGENVPVISSASFFNDDGQLVTLTEEEKKHIFIFDEDYVDKNVKLQQDHLETIVMLGQAADLTEKIEKAEVERDTARAAYEQQGAVFNEYCDEDCVKSPKHYITLLGNAPVVFWIKRSRSARAVSPTTRKPERVSLWPDRYLVPLWTTTSAPSVNGCCR